MTAEMDVIFDIDGTVADLEHRRHFVASKPRNWEAFNARIHLDTPITPIIAVAKAMKAAGHRIIMCSGREGCDVKRPITEQWLADHGIVYDALYMRKAKDYRGDDVVKWELYQQMLLDGFKPVLAFDDRQRVVDVWRKQAGIICAQVAEGDF